MVLRITDDGRLVLEEIDDFTRFHISAAPERLEGEGASPAFRHIAEAAEEGHFWLDADAIVGLSPKSGDADWTSAFRAMLEKAEPYGFADVRGRRIKAHVAE